MAWKKRAKRTEIEPIAATTAVSYLRVSTREQGESGLGLEAQRAAVERYLAQNGLNLVHEYIEVESGRKKNRPELTAALLACKVTKSRLVVAKLDRLARNVHFLSGLMESGVDFVACDLPSADRTTIHVLAAVAEREADLISGRTCAALEAARARGSKLGGYRWDIGSIAGEASKIGAAESVKIRRQKAQERSEYLMPVIRGYGDVSLHQIATKLNADGFTAARGGQWTAIQVKRLMGTAS